MKACRDCGAVLIVPSWKVCQECTNYQRKHKPATPLLYLCNFCKKEKPRDEFSVNEGDKKLRMVRNCDECKEAINKLKQQRYEQW